MKAGSFRNGTRDELTMITWTTMKEARGHESLPLSDSKPVSTVCLRPEQLGQV